MADPDGLDAGVNYIDTAVPYHGGESERFFGRALADGYREKVKIATNLPPWGVKARDDMDQILDLQLKKLQTERIDYYLVHSLEAGQWQRMQAVGVLEFLDAAKASGKIVNAGFSFHGDRKTFREIIDAHDWTFCQIQYNFPDETTQAGTEGLRYSASNGVAVMVMEPLRGGALAGKLPDAVKGIDAAAPVQGSAAEWALRWVWNHPEVTVILSGMNDESHIAENLRVAETALPGAMSGRPGSDRTGRRLVQTAHEGGLHRMRLLHVLPRRREHATVFLIYNDHAMRVNLINARVMYGLSLMGARGTPRADASLCCDCGKCARACPQKIAIPAELKNVDRSLGGLTTRLMGGAFGLVMSRMKVKEDRTE